MHSSEHDNDKGSCCCVVIIILIITGSILYVKGCKSIGTCYVPQKFVGIVTENKVESYDCTQETSDRLTPFVSQCIEYSTTPSCAERRFKTTTCSYKHVYYECLRFQTFNCFNNTLHINYNNNQTCILTRRYLPSNVTMVTQTINSTIDIYIGNDNVCSITNNYISNNTSLIGFWLLITGAIFVLLLCCCTILLKLLDDCIHCTKKNETTINNPHSNNSKPIFFGDNPIVLSNNSPSVIV